MKILTATMLALGVAAATPVFAASTDKTISSVTVNVDVSAMKNAKAIAYWDHLDTDLTQAIMARLVGNITEDAPTLTVTVNSVELADGFEEAAGVAQTKMEAHVSQQYDKGVSRVGTYDVVVSPESVVQYMPTGTTLTAITWDTAGLYTAMVDAFADNVVANIK